MTKYYWKELYSEINGCQKCRLCEQRTNIVIGEGDPKATIMFIGEGPGQQEDMQGLPFVGPAGQLLDKYLYAVGIPREDVYIANILKCRPPKNRDPLPEEEDVCFRFLEEQFRLVKPSIVVRLGRIAAMRVLSMLNEK